MPELPEVQTVVDALRRFVVGAQLLRVEHVRADMISPDGCDLAEKITGRRVYDVLRRGKRIVFHLDNDLRFFVHLGMSGQLTIERPSLPLKPHTHLIVAIDDDRHLRLVDPRRFGGIHWLGNADPGKGLGPEPLTLTALGLHERLSATSRPVKVALLDQAFVAGVGNIYADESLFRAGIDPRTRSDCLTKADAARLARSIRTTLLAAIKAGGSSIRDYVNADGERGDFQTRHRVYGREGEPCPRCDRPITRIVLGGRSTHFCATCQVKS